MPRSSLAGAPFGGSSFPAGSGLACYRNFETNEEPAAPAEPEDDGVDLSDLANISNAL